MMAKRNNQNNPAARFMILLAIVAVPTLFVLAIFSTEWLVQKAVYLLPVLLAAVMAVYSGITTGLLYQYYETNAPWYRFVPCYGELTLMDSKYLHIGSIFYIVAVLFFGASFLPYSVVSVFGEDLAFSLPFYFTIIALFAMLGVEIVKGIGMLDCAKVISSEWEEKMNTSLGLIKTYAWLGFIPFIRVLAVAFVFNKPLSTLVTFRNITVSDTNDVVLDEEEDDAETV